MKRHIIAPTNELLCGCRSFAAALGADREGCARCTAVLRKLVYAVAQLSQLPGTSELCAVDKQVADIVGKLDTWWAHEQAQSELGAALRDKPE